MRTAHSTALAAASEVRATLAALRRDAPGTFAALAERITELRNDPGNPQLRGRVWRTVDNLTVRVPIVAAPDGSTCDAGRRSDGKLAAEDARFVGTESGRIRSTFDYNPAGNQTSIATYRDGATSPNVSTASAGYTSADELAT